MTVKELAEKLDLTTLSVTDGDREVAGAYIGDLLSWVMGRAQSGNVWITIMSNINIVAVAALTDVACVVLAEDVTVDSTVLNTAQQKGINLLATKMTAYELAKQLAALSI